MPTKTFAILTYADISGLGKLKASGCAVLLYSALLTFSRNKTFAFPSISKLSQTIGGAYSEAGIYKALRWLEKNKFIKRNDKRSKQRFIMLKKLIQATSTKVKSALCATNEQWNRKKEKYSFYKRKKRKSFSSSEQPTINSQNIIKESVFSKEEAIWSEFVYRTGGKDVSELTDDNLACMGAFLRSPHQDAVEWREVMWEHCGDVFLAIKEATAFVSQDDHQPQPI